MPLEIRRRKNENTSAFLYRFNKRIQQSGVLKETKKNRFHHRTENKTKRRGRALYRIARQRELVKQRKQGYRASR